MQASFYSTLTDESHNVAVNVFTTTGNLVALISNVITAGKNSHW